MAKKVKIPGALAKTTHNTLIEVAWTLIPVLILVAITDGIQPYGDSLMSWGSPHVVSLIGLGLLSMEAVFE